jgi:hypothetical protein
MIRRIAVVGVVGVLLGLAPPAWAALPQASPDVTAQTDGLVRAIAQDGNLIWLAGRFTYVLDANGTVQESVTNIAAFNATTGADATPSTVAQLGGVTNSIVYDLSVDPSTGTLYAAGTFTVGTASNLVALDGSTGAVVKSFSAPKLSSVLFDNAHVYGGGVSLNEWTAATAKKVAGFTVPKVAIDTSIRGHGNAPAFKDLVRVGSNIVSACECDSITWSGSTNPVKAMVQVDATTGQPQTWSATGKYSPEGDIPGSSAAFGLSLVYDSGADAVYFGAGGSDFAQRIQASTGRQDWKTDTSGSTQAITLFGGNVIVGGHFRWIARTKGQPCGDNAGPNFDCIFAPRLVSLDPISGQAPAPTQETQKDGDQRWMDRVWNPAVCCAYNGTWALTPDNAGTGLWVGGEITKLGTGWSVEAAEKALPPLKYVQNPSNHGGIGRFSA